MSQVKLFASDRLLLLYKTGKLQSVLKQFKKKINEKTFVGAGTNVSVFSYKNGKQVLKLCPANIPYFRRYGQVGAHMGLTPAQQFKEHINSLGNFFLPIKEIFYEDENVFIYIQDKCERLKHNITPHVVAEFFQLIQFMLKRNILLTDLAPNNIGLLNGHIVLFDYHGLHPLKREGRIHRVKWWGRLFRNLVRFITTIYAPEKVDEYSKYLEVYEINVVNKLSNDNLLPTTFIKLLEYVATHENEVALETLYTMLNSCIQTIIDGFHFDSKQLKYIKATKAKLDKFTFH